MSALTMGFSFPDKGVIPERPAVFDDRKLWEERAQIVKPRAVGKTERAVVLTGPGELLGELMNTAMVTIPMIEGVLEAGSRCGLQLERWQAKALAGAAMAASDLLWWPPGSAGSTKARPPLR